MEVTRWDMAVNKNNLVRVNYQSALLRRGFPSPGVCYLCCAPLNQDDFFICARCKNDLPWNLNSYPACAIPVAGGRILCGACVLAHDRPVGNTLALLRYVFPVNRLIHDLKFHAHIEIAGFLGRWMAQFARDRGVTMPEFLIPVPLHASRVRERGYNQSVEIARVIGGILNIPVSPHLYKRTMNTLPQSAVSASLRARNLKGAFSFTGRRKSLPAHVVLIDDVITTGATVNELASMLRENGIGRVDAWAAARTEIVVF